MVTVEQCCEILDSMRIPVTASERECGEYPYYGANGIQGYVSNYIFDDELVLVAEDGGNFGSKEKPIAYRVSGKCWVNNHAHVLKPKEGLDVEYLCYSLMFYRVEGMINGATRKKLTQKALRQMKIPMLKLDEQIKIVTQIKHIEMIKEKRLKQLQKLDELIQARFVEMFGDPIINPFNWEKKRFDSICENLDSRRKPISSGDRVEGIYPYYGASGIVDYVEDYIFDEDILLVSEDGANLLMRSTPIAFSVSGKVWVNNHAHVVKFDEMSLQKYVEIYFSLIDISENITGSAQPKLNQAKLNEMMIPIPEKALLEQYCEFLKQIYKSKLVIKNLLQIYKHQIQM